MAVSGGHEYASVDRREDDQRLIPLPPRSVSIYLRDAQRDLNLPLPGFAARWAEVKADHWRTTGLRVTALP